MAFDSPALLQFMIKPNIRPRRFNSYRNVKNPIPSSKNRNNMNNGLDPVLSTTYPIPDDCDLISLDFLSKGYYLKYNFYFNIANKVKLLDFIKNSFTEVTCSYSEDITIIDGVYNNTEESRNIHVYLVLKSFGKASNNILFFLYGHKDVDTHLIHNLHNSIKVIVGEHVSNEIEIRVFAHSERNGGYASRPIYVDKNNFKHIKQELYPDIYLDKLCQEFVQSKEPILVLVGPPGTGKTSIIKYLLNNQKFSEVIYVKDIKVLSSPQFWADMSDVTNNSLMILDDLDQELTPRNKNKEDRVSSNIMSQLLSFSDGVFSTAKNKIVITTNCEVSKIDPALIRSGRCFDFIQLNPLTSNEAKDIWINVLKRNPDDFNIYFKEKNIPQSDLMSIYDKTITNSTIRSYVKNGSNMYTIHEKLAKLGLVDDKIKI